jgi:hypothetical protein
MLIIIKALMLLACNNDLNLFFATFLTLKPLTEPVDVGETIHINRA